MSKSADWQPIETAPKDGRAVLLWDEDFKMVRTAKFMTHKCGSALWLLAEGHEAVVYLRAESASHWMESPAAPEST